MAVNTVLKLGMSGLVFVFHGTVLWINTERLLGLNAIFLRDKWIREGCSSRYSSLPHTIQHCS